MPTYQTKVLTFTSEHKMNAGIRKMEHKGWTVVGTESLEGQYGCLKTTTLGCLFLPLALLGKGKPTHQVTFQKPM